MVRHVFKPGDRVFVKADAKTVCDNTARPDGWCGWDHSMSAHLGKYRIVENLLPTYGAVSLRGAVLSRGAGAATWPVEALRFVRSAAQAKAAAKKQRARKRNPVVAHVRPVGDAPQHGHKTEDVV